jgi:hypothetical protein
MLLLSFVAESNKTLYQNKAAMSQAIEATQDWLAIGQAVWMRTFEWSNSPAPSVLEQWQAGPTALVPSAI